MQNDRSPASSATRALLTEIIDYAGMFPPASLSLEEALANYDSYRMTAEAWLLARFVCPVVRLDDLVRTRSAAGQSAPLRVAAVLTATNTPAEFDRVLHDGLEAIDRIGISTDVVVQSLELRLPSSLARSRSEEMSEFVNKYVAAVGVSRLIGELYLETPTAAPMDEAVPALVAGLTSTPTDAAGTRSGLKFRCGGPSPEDVPSVRSLAAALHATIRGGIPFKATAGLHHPLRNYDHATQAWMHGFINLFVGAVLVADQNLRRSDLEAILSSTEPAEFSFGERTVGWRRLCIENASVVRARADRATTFGSCSFTEPRDDLRNMGLI